ncbi:MAG: DUF4369 domain-containing protein [Bacteroidota bacterium]
MQKNKIIIIAIAAFALVTSVLFILSRPDTMPGSVEPGSAASASNDTPATASHEKPIDYEAYDENAANNEDELLPADTTLPLTAEELAKAAAYPATATYGLPFRFKIRAAESEGSFKTPEQRKIYLLADADTHWVMIDSTMADTNGAYSFTGVAPGKGMYILVQDTAKPDYPRVSRYEYDIWSVVLPLDSNTVLVKVYPAKDPDGEENDTVASGCRNPGLDPWINFAREIDELYSPANVLAAERNAAQGNWEFGNNIVEGAQAYVYDLAPSPMAFYGFKYAMQGGKAKGYKAFVKKLIAEMQKGGISAGRVAEFRKWVKNLPD